MDQDSFLYPKSQEQYHKNLMTLATQVEKLTEALKKKKSNPDLDSTQLKQLDAKLQTLVSQNDILNQNVSNKQLQIEQLNLKIQVLDQAYMAGNMRLQESNTNLAVLQGRNKQLEGDLQNQQLIFQQKMNEYNNLLNSYRAMNDNIQKLREENKSLKDKNSQLDQSSLQDATNKDKEKEIESIHRNYKKLLEERQKEVDDLTFAKKFINDEWVKTRNEMDQLKRELEQAKRDAERNSRDLEQAKKDAERNARQSLSMMSLQEEARLKFELGAKHEEEERALRRVIEDKEITIDQLKQTIYQLKQQIQTLQNQQNQSQNQSQPKIQEEQYNELYQKSQQLIRELEQKDQQLVQQDNLVEKLSDQITMYQEKEKNLKAEIQLLRDRLASLSQSQQPTPQPQPLPPQNQQYYMAPQQAQQPKLSSPPRASVSGPQFMPETSSLISPQRQSMMAPNQPMQQNPQRLQAAPSMSNLQPVRYSQAPNPNRNSLAPPQQMFQRK